MKTKEIVSQGEDFLSEREIDRLFAHPVLGPITSLVLSAAAFWHFYQKDATSYGLVLQNSSQGQTIGKKQSFK